MSEMIDRVAAAIVVVQSGPRPWSYEEVARAAIEAMREPSVDMCLAGSSCFAEAPANIFDAMIDEALK